MKPYEWLMSHDTGTSSKTIFDVMVGIITEPIQCNWTYDTPHDPADFGRCYRLLKHFPEWENRLPEVAKLLPKWQPMVREWAKLKSIYERDYPSGSSEELYQIMKSLEEEGMILDGWIKDSPCSWIRKEATH